MSYIDHRIQHAEQKDAALRLQYDVTIHDRHTPYTLTFSHRTICVRCTSKRKAQLPWWKRWLCDPTVEFPCDVILRTAYRTLQQKNNW